jgi:hypothetical protein
VVSSKVWKFLGKTNETFWEDFLSSFCCNEFVLKSLCNVTIMFGTVAEKVL